MRGRRRRGGEKEEGGRRRKEDRGGGRRRERERVRFVHRSPPRAAQTHTYRPSYSLCGPGGATRGRR